MIFHSLNTLRYFVRKKPRPWLLITSISTGVQACTNVVQLGALECDALPGTTVVAIRKFWNFSYRYKIAISGIYLLRL